MIYQGRDLDVLSVAWAAGFLDGEGCFTITRSAPRRQFAPRIHAAQIVQEPLDKLLELFGGHVALRDTRHRPLWYWEVAGATAVVRVLPLLIPHLLVKRAQAEMLLEFASRIDPRNGGKRLSDDEFAIREEYTYVLSEMKR